MKRIGTVIIASIVPGSAAAHPLHGVDGSVGFLHYFSDPFHLGLTAVGVLAFFALRTTLRQRRTQKQRIR